MIYFISIIISILLNYIFKNNLIRLIKTILISSIISYFLYLIQKDTFCFLINNISITLLLCLIKNKLIINDKCKKSIKYKYMIISLIFLLISTFTELFILNFRHYESLFYKDNKTLKITNYNNLEKLDKKTYEIKNHTNYIEINNINKKTDNIYIDLESTDYVKNITIYATDDANKNYYKLGDSEIINNINESKYKKINISGKLKSLKISFAYDENIRDLNIFKYNVIKINVIKINEERPMSLSLIRILLIFFISQILYIIRPKSEVYNIKCIFNKKQNQIIIIYLVLQTLLFTAITCMNPIWLKGGKFLPNQREYNVLAENIVKNNTVELKNYKVSNTLKKMKNPYDTHLRKELHDKNNEVFMHDHAYYKGKYYVYFGIVPCILFYVPFYLLTKKNLYNSIVILFLLISVSIITILLIKYLIKKHFKNVSFAHFLLLSIFAINSSGLLYISKRADLYSVPIMCALFFSLLGLYLWITSINENNTNKKRLLLGSLSMALVAGCRPQFLITSFFSLIIFKEYFLELLKNKKRLIKELLLFIIPYIIVAIPLMIYNYVRFDSIFDFGANYNLTTNDMTKRGFKLDRTFLGYYYFLISQLHLTPTFPFVEYENIKTNYLGTTIFEPFNGGLIYNNILLIFGILVFKFKKLINNNRLYKFCITSIIFALVIIFVDTQGAGILPRYINDFSYLFFIPAIIVLLAILNSLKNEKNKVIFNYIFCILLLLSLFNNIIQIPTDLSFEIMYFNPTLYYLLKYFISFWL